MGLRRTELGLKTGRPIRDPEVAGSNPVASTFLWPEIADLNPIK